MKVILTLFTLSILSLSVFAQNALEKQRMVAILDLQERNQEDDSRIFGTEQLAIAAGFPYIITANLAEAIGYGFILSSSDINATTFSTAATDTLKSYVQAGGILLTSNMRDYRLNDVFGVSSFVTARNNYTLNWDIANNDSTLLWFDKAREQEVILGKSTISEVIYTRHYVTTSGTPLAYFNNNTSQPAVVVNQYGNGFAYALGYSLRDVSLRNMLNYDYTTERDFSNGFEPNADVHALFLRAWFSKHGKAMVWKHTSPANSYNTVLITHDIDSRTGMDTMLQFSAWEKNVNIVADYNVTTRYFADSAMSDFYAGKETKVNAVRDDGHRINSHSVGHFFDFHEFEMGPYGESVSTYFPFYNGTETTGGFVLPELQVSKNLLESNHGVSIETFRAGHLRYPKKLPNALDTLGYRYDGTMSTNDMGYSFPFPLRKDRSFSGEITNVYEIGMTLSDVVNGGFNSSNYQQVVSSWVANTKRYRDNYSPVTLLIHPNRTWKLWAEQSYIAQLGLKTLKLHTKAYGDYWRMRESVEFTSVVSNDTLFITIPNSQLPLHPSMSFMTENADEINEVMVQSSVGNTLDLTFEKVQNTNRILVYNADLAVGDEEPQIAHNASYLVYPNPTNGSLTIQAPSSNAITLVELFDLTGKLVYHTKFTAIHQTSFNLNDGIYILKFTDLKSKNISTQKLVIN